MRARNRCAVFIGGDPNAIPWMEEIKGYVLGFDGLGEEEQCESERCRLNHERSVSHDNPPVSKEIPRTRPPCSGT